MALRPEQVLLGPTTGGAQVGVVGTVDYFGHDALVRVFVPSGAGSPDCMVLSRVVGDDAPEPGQRVGVTVRGPVLTFQRPIDATP